MQDYLIWTILGFVLVIVELMTGTFYLLVLGVGALFAALAAWMGAAFIVQVAVAGVVASIGTWLVQKWHATQRKDGDQQRNVHGFLLSGSDIRYTDDRAAQMVPIL